MKLTSNASGGCAIACPEARSALLAGRADRAKEILLTLLENQPQCPEALHMLALVQCQIGEYAEAARLMLHAITILPHRSTWYADLAVVYSSLGNWREAENHANRALELDPESATAILCRGKVRLHLGDADGALHFFRRLSHVAPGTARPMEQCAQALANKGDFDDAVALLEHVLEAHPNRVESHRLLGRIYHACGQTHLATLHWEQVLSVSSDDEAHAFLALLYWEVGDLESTLDQCRSLIGKACATEELHSFYLYLLLYRPQETALTIRESCSEFARRFCPAAAPTEKLAVAGGQPRLRVGYLTGEFIYGPAFYFLSALIGNHNAERIETFLYHTRQQADSGTASYQQMGHWRDCRDIDDERLIESIRADGIDVLVDLSGFFPGHRLRVFAKRAAPIQVTYPNCPITTGLGQMDYILTDRWTCPPGQEGQYTEKPVFLPRGYLAYVPPSDAPPVQISKAWQGGALTFGLFQRVAKMNSAVWNVIAEILRQAPTSRLLIHNSDETLDDPASVARVRVANEFGSRMVGESQLQFRGAREHAESMRIMGNADIALDTFPYQGQTTTCECLWMGVPVIALAGDRHVARVGSGILERVGLAELSAATTQEYIRKALELAKDIPALTGLRGGMRDRLRKSPLLDAKRLAHDVEEAYRWMLEAGERNDSCQSLSG